MSKKYIITVGNKVSIPVKFTLKEGNVNKLFAFTLYGNRLDQDVIEEKMTEGGFKFKEGLLSMHKSFVDPTSKEEGLFTGWDGQRLICTEDGTPAEFCTEALEAMLSIPVVASIIYKAYLLECGAKEKN